MPASKYERELRFIESETARLMRLIAEMVEAMPQTPQEANMKAANIEDMQKTIAEMEARRKEIVDSFVKAGMDVPDISRSMNATVHNAGAYEIRTPAEAEAKAGLGEAAEAEAPETGAPKAEVRRTGPRTSDDVGAEIADVTAEINSLEARLVKAEITGDEEEKQKVSMMISSLRSRRGSLIEEAKAVREEEARAASAGPAGAVDAATIMRIDALEADNRALRNQIADVRGGLQDVKEQLRQIMHALGIEEDD